MFNNLMILAEVDATKSTPFGILTDFGLDMAKDPSKAAGTHDYIKQLGLPQLGFSLTVLGIWSGILIAFAGLLLLAIVKYPKTVAQVKTKLAVVAIGLVIIAVAPYMFDVLAGMVKQLVMGM